MKLGIMQPYFFPYIGYFSLICQSDKFIFFDTPQYISSGWVNRNRILKSDGTPGYITVPVVKAARETAIKDICISNPEWKQSFFGQLTAYKRKAPKYKDTLEFLHEILDCKEYVYLSELNIDTLIKTSEHIGIHTEFETYSKMNLDIEQVNAPDEWALNITKALGGDTYINPPGGMSFFDPDKYRNSNIRLQFLKSNLKPYIQRIGRFEPGLSIIDVLMFCDTDEIRNLLEDFEIIEA